MDICLNGPKDKLDSTVLSQVLFQLNNIFFLELYITEYQMTQSVVEAQKLIRSTFPYQDAMCLKMKMMVSVRRLSKEI